MEKDGLIGSWRRGWRRGWKGGRGWEDWGWGIGDWGRSLHEIDGMYGCMYVCMRQAWKSGTGLDFAKQVRTYVLK